MGKKALGSCIYETRKYREISSDKLAELCDVGAVHIRKIESGMKNPSIQLFVKICNALSISPKYLLQDSLEQNVEKFPCQDCIRGCRVL